MADVLKSLWIIPALRGLLAILFGLILFTYPGVSLVLLLTFFGAFVMVSGIFTLVMAVARRHYDIMWKTYFTDGLVSVAIGLLVFCWPGITSLILIYLIGIWALISGLMQLVNAYKMRQFFTNIWLSLFMGILLSVFALSILVHPGAGAVAISFIIGLVAFTYGIVAIIFAFQLRKAGRV